MPDKKIIEELANTMPEDSIFCEVGIRSGDSAMISFEAIKNSNKNRWFFTVDPHGNKPYLIRTDSYAESIYPDQHHRDAMYTLSKYAYENNLLHTHWRMTSYDFMKHIEDIEFYHDGEKIEYKFGFVYLDGEHHIKIVKDELEWFKKRMVSGGMIVIDDADFVIPDYYLELNGMTREELVKFNLGEDTYLENNDIYYKHE